MKPTILSKFEIQFQIYLGQLHNIKFYKGKPEW